MTTNNQPLNKDFLSGLNYDFVVDKLPTTKFFVTQFATPDVVVDNVGLQTQFKPVFLPADKLSYGMVQIYFKVDARMQSWLEVLNWMKGVGFPSSFNQRAAMEPNNVRSLYSDATLVVADYHKNPIITWKFYDILPAHLSGIVFASDSIDPAYQQAAITFNFRDMDLIQNQ